MNLVAELEKAYNKTQRNKIVRYVGTDPKRFTALVKAFLDGPYRTTQRAAWPLSYCVEHHPELVKPHLKALLKNLKKPGQQVAVKRNTLRLMQFIQLPGPLQGEAAQISFDLLSDKKETIAVRVFAMTVLANLAGQQPELKNEIIPIIEDQMAYSSPAFRSRGSRVLKTLKK